MNPVRAAIWYVAIMLAFGFVFGALRVAVIAPRLGAPLAVMLEAPVMLVLSWFVCGGILRRFRVPAALPQRAAMGGVAFAVLMLAELAGSILLFGRSAAEHVHAWRTTPGLMGLITQILFALVPVAHLYLRGGGGERSLKL